MTTWMFSEVQRAPESSDEDVTDWLQRTGTAAIRALGGSIWGLWSGRPGIGFASDALLLACALPDDAAAGASVECIRACEAIIDVGGTPLRATARPVDTSPCEEDGIWVFRDFLIARESVDRFLELSTEAWPSFEENFDVRIHGLFRAPDTEPDQANLLLVTRYSDLATWEASRVEASDPEAWARFRERHAMTVRTRARSAIRIHV